MLNCAVLMGRLTANPVLSVTPTGKDVCSFQIAVDRNVSQGERKADFITIVAWEGMARRVEKYFRKGSMIAVQGSIQTRQYEDKGGSKRTAFEVVAREVHFCGSKNEGKVSSVSREEALEKAKEGLNQSFSNATAADFEEICCDDDYGEADG